MVVCCGLVGRGACIQSLLVSVLLLVLVFPNLSSREFSGLTPHSVVLVLHPKTIPDCTFNMALFLQVGNIVPMQEISCGTLIFMPQYVHCRHVQHLKKIKGKMARKEALRSRLQNLMVCFIPSLKQISVSAHGKTMYTLYLTGNMWPFQAC